MDDQTQKSADTREKLLSFWRRRRTFWSVAAAAAMVTILLAVLLPPTYRAMATILIEQQEIPQELVRSVITSFADQRVQVISQRVMTTQNLLSLIERYNLYPAIREKQPREVLLAKMRDDIGMHMISADVIDPRSGRPTQATIAFSVSYQSRSPELALKVANELTTLYLNENLTSRTQLSQQTSAFFSEEATRQQARITELDKNLAAFKEKHHDDLPELAQLNVQTAERTDLDLRDAENRIAALDSERVLLQAQLAQISPNTQVFTDSGQRVFGPEDRLKALKSQLASYKARYGADHPDVISTQREVDGLEKAVAAEDGTADRLRQLSEAKAKLAGDLEKYSAEHPDVVRLKHEIDALEKAVQADANAGTQQTERSHADNPVYIQVKGQLDALTVDRESAVKKRDALRAKFEDYEKRLAQSPEVERQYREMARGLESAQFKYQEILSKQTEAQVSQNLETERKGEKFTLIEPPQPPEKPISPNRKLILIVGLLLSVALGVGAVVARDSFDASVRGPNDIRQLLQVSALASIPIIVTEADRKRLKRINRYSWGGGVATVLVAAVIVHIFVRPLDVVWLSLMQRFGI
ncbi:MAG: Wzz/FepE/Etk N-terminal domain-containing protein [Steroidobacteraceae bacterium]